MRTLRYIISSFILMYVISACSESFLNLSPEGNLNEDIFFKTPEDFEQALVGAYEPLRSIANIAYLMDECRSDNARYFYYAKDRGGNNTEIMTNYVTSTDNGIILERYSNAYVGVSRSNTILDRIEAVEFADNGVKNRIIGEAKVLRAHYYFDLVRKFGGVPLFLSEVTVPSQAYKARASEEEVYNQIIVDLRDAVDLLPNPTFSTGDIGRINKGVASTELAKVYLTRGDYSAAIPLLESVTSMGYELIPNFKDVFDPSNKGNTELIWDIQYQSGTTGQGSEFIYDFIPVMPNTGPILGTDFNNTQGGWNYPTQDLIDLYEDEDSRFGASIAVFEGELNVDDDFVASDSSYKSIVGYSPDPDKEVRYFPNKFYFPTYPERSQGTDQNWPIYRYSEVLLMLAECYNESGQGRDPGKALGYLNQVRNRAFGGGSHDITDMDQSSLRTIIETERRLELAFENKRYNDLIRTNRLVSVMTEFGNKMKEKHSYLLPEAYTLNENDRLFPIPFQEMQLNDLLVQNPGY